ncbi:hypothetical protein H0H93_004985 [Arthromyces matolae]|nr:hypothetical protein H0H93_004985 [Arthromyces matolae]
MANSPDLKFLQRETFSPDTIGAKINQGKELLKKYKKAAKPAKEKMGGEVTTLVGSPNDGQYQGNVPHLQLDQHRPQGQGSGPNAGTQYDPQLLENPTKSSTMQPQPSILKDEALTLLRNGLSYTVVSQFVNAWEGKYKEIVVDHDFAAGFDSFRDLINATAALEDAIFQACLKTGVSYSFVDWPAMKDHTRPSSFSEMRSILDWMCQNFDIQLRAATSIHNQQNQTTSSSAPATAFKVYDYDEDKWVKMTPALLKEARDCPEKWLGCVEQGLSLIQAVLRNHTGAEKCLSHKNGPRGQHLVKPILPGQPVLSGCGCPLDTAALELWLSKVTSKDIGPSPEGKKVPPFKMEQLHLFQEALQHVSGLNISRLLQSEEDRLKYTVKWALKRLMETYPDERNYVNLLSRASSFVDEALKAIPE